MRESLTLRQTSTPITPLSGTLLLNFGDLGPLGSVSGYSVVDQFRTLNQFNGGQLGLRGTSTYRALSLTLGVKTAYGENRRTVDAAGYTNVFAPQSLTTLDVKRVPTTGRMSGGIAGMTTNTGLFAGPSNRGASASSVGSFLAEGNLEVGLMVTDRLRLRFGYGALYWTGVAAGAATRLGDRPTPIADHYII